MNRKLPVAAGRVIAAGFAALVMTASALSADFGSSVEIDMSMSWNTVDCGGGMSSYGQGPGTSVQLTGTIGQHDALSSGPLTGGVYRLDPGFWSGTSAHGTTCTGDVAPAPAGDHLVNVDDLLLVITTWGTAGAGDANHSGLVNVDDLLAVITAWGACP